MEKSAAESEKTVILSGMLDSASSVCIISHMHPDGDAVGSSVAMYRYLTELRGLEACIVLPDSPQRQLEFLCGGVTLYPADKNYDGAVSALRRSDLIICLDFNHIKRTGCLAEVLSSCKAAKIMIDHHLDPEAEPFSLVVSETEVSSASELLFHILCDLEKGAGKLPESCLRALLTGMTTDTNNFANSVYPSTLNMATTILSMGVDRDEILSHLYNEYRENRVRAMGYLLSKMVITPEGIAYMILNREELHKFDLKEGETEAFVNIPLSIDKVKFSIFIKEDCGFFRVSIRSKKGYSANELARKHFHGGGHEQAAGGRLLIPDDIPDSTQAASYIEEMTARFMKQTAARII